MKTPLTNDRDDWAVYADWLTNAADDRAQGVSMALGMTLRDVDMVWIALCAAAVSGPLTRRKAKRVVNDRRASFENTRRHGTEPRPVNLAVPTPTHPDAAYVFRFLPAGTLDAVVLDVDALSSIPF